MKIMKLNKQTAGFFLATAALCLVAVGADAQAPASTNAQTNKLDSLFGDPVIARGTGIEIRQSRLDEAMASVKAGAISRGQEISPAQMPLLEKQVFDNLLMNTLLTAKATDAEKAKGKEEGDKRFDIIEKRASSKETLTKQLKA